MKKYLYLLIVTLKQTEAGEGLKVELNFPSQISKSVSNGVLEKCFCGMCKAA